MAARKAKEKSSLSRQEIASRKRVISEKKVSTDSHAKRALAGVFVLAASVMSLLSMATFDARDRVGPGFHNAVGPVGHALADGLLSALGACAYVVPVAGLYAAIALFVGTHKRRWPQLVAVVLGVLSSAVLANLFFADKHWHHPPGGMIGSELSDLLSGWFSTLGTVVLVSAICVSALIVGTQFAFLKLCSVAWAGASALGAQAKVGALALWQSQRQALVVRREEAAKAKLEEQAFLAQLEADEEELAEAEREVAEADAIAEEAHRLEEEKAEVEAEPPPEPKKKPRIEKPEKIELAVSSPSISLVPGADPAWASMLSSAQSSSPVPAPATEPVKTKRERKPQIALPPGPIVSSPRIEAADATPALVPVPVATPAPIAPIIAPQAAPAPVAAAPVFTPPTPTALARTPLIVEPKAPPKPTKRPQEFQFVGDRTSFTLPPIDVLEADKAERTALDKEVYLSTAEKLRAKLADFGIVGEVVEIRPGPVVTMYEFLPGPGIKVSKIASLADDLAMAMEAMRVRIVAPIPGKGVVGIEVPNRDRETVFLKEIAEQDTFTKSGSKLTMCVGKDIEGMPYVLDLAKAPHLLMAGTTGSGKSVAVNSMIMSILLKATPEEVRFIMVDPKMLELSVYEGIPHLLLPVVTDPKKAAMALRWAVEEMERRYHLLSDAGVRNISGYNKLVETTNADAKNLLKQSDSKIKKTKASEAIVEGKPAKKMLIVDVAEDESEEDALKRNTGASLGVAAPREPDEDMREAIAPEEEGEPSSDELEPEVQTASSDDAAEPDGKKELQKLPYIVVIIDELADLMMVASREVETYIARLAQMARAAGIHLMVATQRPSTDVVTGVIKANFPTRISFMLRSKPDSMTILGTVGAEALLGMGDMLIMPPTSAHMQRVHGAYVSEIEIKRAVDHLKAQGKPVYDESILKAREEENDGTPPEDELSDELWDQALAVVSTMQNVSISMLQRKMRIGYNRAARMIERMEREGIVGAADGAKPREVLLRPVGEMPGAGAV